MFAQARAPAPWTVPSMVSLMTGESPLVHGATYPGAVVPEDLTTLAERMTAAGYYTGAIGHQPFLLSSFHFDRGFREYNLFPKLTSNAPLGAYLSRLVLRDSVGNRLDATTLTDRAREWVREHAEENFFLWLHYYDVHQPYRPPARFMRDVEPAKGMSQRWFSDGIAVRGGHLNPTLDQREWIENLYRGEVRYVDEQIGRVLDVLEELDIYEDALVVITSDHGEEFWEHGGFEHGHTVYDELLAVPLLIKAPGQEVGRRDDRVISIEAVMPTILSLCGLTHETTWPSSAPLLDAKGEPKSAEQPSPLLSTGTLYFDDQSALFSSGHKYVRNEVTGEEKLFDLATDVGEMRSVLGSSPDLHKDLKTRCRDLEQLARSIRELRGLEGSENADLDGTLLEKLRSLGYVK